MLVLEIAVGVFIALVADRGLGGFVKYRAEEHRKRQHQKAIAKGMKEAVEGLVDILEKAKADHEHDERLEDALEKATAEVKKGSKTPLTTRQYAAVEKRFHEITGDHYIKLERAANGKADVTFSSEPFTKPATKKAPVKKPVARKVAEVKVPPVPAKKVTTKKGKK